MHSLQTLWKKKYFGNNLALPKSTIATSKMWLNFIKTDRIEKNVCEKNQLASSQNSIKFSPMYDVILILKKGQREKNCAIVPIFHRS